MSLLRRLTTAAGVCALFAVASASASMLPFASAAVGAGDGATAVCDPDGVTVTYTNSFDTSAADYRTSAATIAGIATTCTGQALSLTIANASGSPIWQATTTVTATTITLTPPAALQSSAIARWAVSITG